MKAAELRKKSQDELKAELLSLFQEQFNMRVQKGVGQTPRTHLFKKIRREIARIKTILSQQEKGQ